MRLIADVVVLIIIVGAIVLAIAHRAKSDPMDCAEDAMRYCRQYIKLDKPHFEQDVLRCLHNRRAHHRHALTAACNKVVR